MFGILVFWFIVLVSAQDDSRIVTIASGKVRGHKDKDYDIFVFNGIPYATAPPGPYKFRAPLPAPVWKDTLDATEAHIMCPQYQIFKGPAFIKHKIREDCLVANIYVPNTEEKHFPVLVDIHGGNFMMGYGNMLTLKELVNSKRIIVVNFNYRLGAHGFLCLGTKDVPGNAGMKDMVALLRWVKNNIAAFGGDPDEVTITEYSAGASAVDLLLLSPSAKGLFKRAIPESGPNLSVYSIQMDPIEVAKHFANIFNFHDGDIYALENFYKTLSYEGLSKDNIMVEVDETMQFVPCIERDLGDETFLSQSPYDLLSLGYGAKVPILYGFTNMKWMHKKEQFEFWNTKINENFSQLFPTDLKFDSKIEKESVAKTIKEFYFGKDLLNFNFDSVQAFVNYFTDLFFAYGTFRSVRLQVEAGNDQVYLYEYTFLEDDEDTGSEDYHIHRHVQGQGELLYETKNLGVTNNKTESDIKKRVRKTVMELWLNFISEGTPVPTYSTLPTWPPATAEGHPLMSIGNTLHLRGHQKERWNRMNFWHDIYDRYYRDPSPPPDRSSRVEL